MSYSDSSFENLHVPYFQRIILILSQNLSGCPSVTDSEVKNMFFGYMDMAFSPPISLSEAKSFHNRGCWASRYFFSAKFRRRIRKSFVDVYLFVSLAH
jgi:hypothetical protein